LYSSWSLTFINMIKSRKVALFVRFTSGVMLKCYFLLKEFYEIGKVKT
jgi:hypothetical protein